MKKIAFCFGLLTMLSTSVIAQTCKENIESSHQAEQYIDNGDGTITDVINELMWAKCSLGQTFTNGNCDGMAASYATWTEALLAAEMDLNYIRDTDDWRLPNIKELGSLIERACVAPAIDIHLFPTTPGLPYWSNTFDKIGVNAGENGLVIDFKNGSEVIKPSEDRRLIRLVRSLSEPDS